MRREGCITLFCQRFCLKVPGIFVGDPFWFSEKNRVSKNFRQKKGISIFCANNFLSRRVQKLRGGTRLCFKKFLVSKNVMDKRRGGCSTILCQSFCLTVPKTFAGEPLCFSEKNRLSKNSTHKKRILSFCAINFLSRRVQKLRGGTRLCFRKLLVSKNVMDKRRGVHITTLSKTLSHKTENFRRGTLLCFRKFRVSEIFMDKRRRGVSHFFIKIFVSQYRKIL